MNDKNSLEAERQALLARMQANREQYRRMLMENPDVHTHGSYEHGEHAVDHGHSAYRQYGHSFADYRDWRHNPALRWMKDHPFLCAAAVAAVVAIGPRRVARSVVSSGTALTALTLRNQANVDMLGRLITTVVSYMQRERTRPPM